MAEPSSTIQGCAECARLRAELAELKARFAELEAKLAKAQKNSSNSSKPPSSDITNPPAKPGKQGPGAGTKRKRGGQPGHPRHTRPAFLPDELDEIWIHYYTGCPCCGGPLDNLDEPPKIMQQVEIEELPIVIEEHQRFNQCCQKCGKVHLVPWPEDLKRAGLVGPRLTTLIGYMKSACHMSFSGIRKFLRDVVNVTISRGQLRKLVAKVADSLQDPYQQLLALLPEADVLNVDETGHKDNGRRMWTWCFRAASYTVFKISPSRSSNVLLDVLGQEFDGLLGCDYFGAYRKYMRLNENVTLQFCLAHFIRDVKFLAEHPNKQNREHGLRLLEHFRKLFQTIHRRDEYATGTGYQYALRRIRQQLVHDAIINSPGTREADNLGERFCRHFDSFFTFITEPGIDPTNNVAEQAIRFVAIHRRLTQGTRGEAGQTWCERIWTAIATCEQQGRSFFKYLHEAVLSYFHSQPAPSLVPAPNTS